jgi:cobalamin biosynthesis protein CobT
MRLNISAVEREATIRAKHAGLTIRLEDDFKPRTNGKTIYLEKPNPLWSDRKWALWWYTYEHELGHNDPAMMDRWEFMKEKKFQPNTFLPAMINLLADNIQEHHRYEEYAGRKKRLNEGRAIFYEEKVEHNSYGQTGADPRRLAAETLMVWDAIIRAKWMPAVTGLGDKMAESLNDQQHEWLDKLKAGDYEEAINSSYLDAVEEYELTKRIIEEVFEFDAEEMENEAQQPQSGEGDEGDEEGDGEGSGDVRSVSESDGDGDSGEGEEDGKRSKKAVVNYSDLLAHSHESLGESNPEAYGESLKINYDAHTGHYDPASPSDFRILDYAGGKIQPLESEYCVESIENRISHSSIDKQVRRMLQSKMQTRYEHGLKRGRLSTRSIYRGGMRGTGEYQKKIYKKKSMDTTSIQNTVVGMVCDCSGSMWGSKYNNMGASAVLLNEAISSLNVPLEIIGFDDDDAASRIAIWKAFKKPVTKQDLIARISDGNARLMCNNADGEVLAWEYERILAQPEAKKVMIMLSDGSPAGFRGDADWYTQQVIKQIEGDGLVDLYGIGIEDDNVARLYTNWQVINDSSELEEALVSFVSNKLIK